MATRQRRRDVHRTCLRAECAHPQIKHERSEDLRHVGACRAIVPNVVDGINEPKQCECSGFVGGDVGVNRERRGF